MGQDITETIKRLRQEVQDKCRDRLDKAGISSIDKIVIKKPFDYGISSVLKKKHGL